MFAGCGDNGRLLEGNLGDRGEVGVYRPEYCSECMLKMRSERCEEDERRRPRPLPFTKLISSGSEEEWLNFEGEFVVNEP